MCACVRLLLTSPCAPCPVGGNRAAAAEHQGQAIRACRAWHRPAAAGADDSFLFLIPCPGAPFQKLVAERSQQEELLQEKIRSLEVRQRCSAFCHFVCVPTRRSRALLFPQVERRGPRGRAAEGAQNAKHAAGNKVNHRSGGALRWRAPQRLSLRALGGAHPCAPHHTRGAHAPWFSFCWQMVKKLAEAHDRNEELLKEIQALRTAAEEEKVGAPCAGRLFLNVCLLPRSLTPCRSPHPPLQGALEASLAKAMEEIGQLKTQLAEASTATSDAGEAKAKAAELASELEAKATAEV